MREMTLGMWLRKPVNFRMLSTPHDLAMCLGPWILLTLVLGAVVARIWVGGWQCLLVVVVLQVPAIQFFSNYCDALNVKYATEGVRFQGTVIKTWEFSEHYGSGSFLTTVRQVSYQVDDFQYITEFKMSLGVVDAPSTNFVADLVRLPGYPKSAILATSVKPVKSVDPDFPTQYRDFSTSDRNSLQFAILAMTCLRFPVLYDLTKKLGWPVSFFFIPMIVLFFICAYWITTKVQELKWPQLLYGSKQVQDTDGAAPAVSSEEQMSHEELRQRNQRHSELSRSTFFCVLPMYVLSSIREYWITTQWPQWLYGAKQVQDKDDAAPLASSSEEHVSHEELRQLRQLDHDQRFSYATILRIAVEPTLWLAHVVAFGGSYCACYDLAVPRWERTLLERYASETDISFVVGSVLCERESFMNRTEVIVQFKADNNRLYKKRLYRRYHNKLPDSLELVYLKGLPESAISKVHLMSDLGRAIRVHQLKFLLSISLMAFQIGILALIVNTFLETRFLWVAGMLLVCNFVMGVVGVWIHYKTVVEREILGDAKQVCDGTQMETTPKAVDDTAQVERKNAL